MYYKFNKITKEITKTDSNEMLTGDYGDRILGRDKIGPFLVSTVFLPIDHGWGNGNKPILFETMIFMQGFKDEGLGDDLYSDRYRSYEEAMDNHEFIVAKLTDLWNNDSKFRKGIMEGIGEVDIDSLLTSEPKNAIIELRKNDNV